MPALISIDGKGEVLLFFQTSSRGTGIQRWDLSDLDNPQVKFDVTSLSTEQLTTEYIQNLLDKIANLEQSGTALNRTELLQLNAELDAILSVLRQ